MPRVRLPLASKNRVREFSPPYIYAKVLKISIRAILPSIPTANL